MVPSVAELSLDAGARTAYQVSTRSTASGVVAEGLVRGAGVIVGGAYEGRWWSKTFVVEAEETDVRWPPRATDEWRRW